MEPQTYTEEQVRMAEQALMMCDALPVNPSGVARSLHESYAAELEATHSTEESKHSPAAVLMLDALCQVLGVPSPYSIDEWVDARNECRRRVGYNEEAV